MRYLNKYSTHRKERIAAIKKEMFLTKLQQELQRSPTVDNEAKICSLCREYFGPDFSESLLKILVKNIMQYGIFDDQTVTAAIREFWAGLLSDGQPQDGLSIPRNHSQGDLTLPGAQSSDEQALNDQFLDDLSLDGQSGDEADEEMSSPTTSPH